ncbi:hypothetical protein [Photobacterium leiognathi]|nr:hypothetical protein [Photobacterium leiognathi]
MLYGLNTSPQLMKQAEYEQLEEVQRSKQQLHQLHEYQRN